MSKARIMYNMTVEEIREGLKEMKTVFLPIGVVEQHGYHMPLSVDIHNAYEISKMASERCGCFVAPPVHYSFSGGSLPGTINIPPQLFSMVVMEICHSLVVQGFKNIAIILGHGGTENVRASFDAAENFQRLNPDVSGVTISVVPFWEFSPTYMKSFEEKCQKMHMSGVSTVRFYRKHKDPMIKLLMGVNPVTMALHSVIAENGSLIKRCCRKAAESPSCREIVFQHSYLSGVKAALRDPSL
jgi:hypothetical protein